MDEEQGERGPGEIQRLPGEVTGQLAVGGYLLEVGAAAGTSLTVTAGDTQSATALGEALNRDDRDDRRKPLTAFEQDIEDADTVTAKAERSVELFTDLAEGRFLDRRVLNREIDLLLETLTRLDQAGRFEDEVKLARSLSKLLALTLRWAALVETLRRAFKAATALADNSSSAWALHELGTYSLVAGELNQSHSYLTEARQLRRTLGEELAIGLSEHNLLIADEQLRSGAAGPRLTGRLVVIAGAIAILLIGGAGLAVALSRDHSNPEPAVTPAGSSAPSTRAPTSTKGPPLTSTTTGAPPPTSTRTSPSSSTAVPTTSTVSPPPTSTAGEAPPSTSTPPILGTIRTFGPLPTISVPSTQPPPG
jgi:hypothetical protein